MSILKKESTNNSAITRKEFSANGSLMNGSQDRSIQEQTRYEPDQETSFRMPALPQAKLDPGLIEKSHKLNRIYDIKVQMEKQYGEPVTRMNPIKHINLQYDRMYHKQQEEKKEQLRQQLLE